MNILLAIIPIFVAVDPVGLLPIFVSLTRELDRKQRLRILFESLLTALCLAAGFIFLGKAIFNLLGITVGDFMVAGGAILFCLAIIDLIHQGKPDRIPVTELGVVPLGTPLIVGPAVLTTCLILIDQHGLAVTLLSVIINLLFVGLLFSFSDALMRILGEGGTKALSKLMSLLLAAIGVMMIRKGLMHIISAAKTSYLP